MMETISDSKLSILSLTIFPYIGKTKMTLNIKIRNNPIVISRVVYANTVHIQRTQVLCVCVSTHSLCTLLN